MKRTYQGSCHCGAIRFEAAIDLAGGTSRCNCSACRKGRFWKAIVGEDAVRLLQGEDALVEYRFGSQAIRHFFCRRCGIKPFGRANLPELGPFFAINIACLDDATDAELAAAPVRYEDGVNDAWERPPAETRHL